MGDMLRYETNQIDSLRLNAQVFKRWGIINPTNTTIKFKGIGRESGLVHHIPNKYLDNNRVYITINYGSNSASQNLTHFKDYGDNIFTNKVNDEWVILSVDIDSIKNNPCGVYVDDVDLVLGSVTADIHHPSENKAKVAISNSNAIYHQFFLNVASKADGNVYIRLGDTAIEVQCVEIGGVTGLYSLVSRKEGEELTLIDPYPTYSTNVNDLKTAEPKVATTKAVEEMKNFSALVERVLKGGKQNSEESVEEIKESNTLRKEARADVLDEHKQDRQINKEERAAEAERVNAIRTNSKTVYDLASKTAKLL